MNFKINIEDNNHMKKFFKQNNKYEKLIRDNIQEALPILIVDKPYKIKTAYGYKYKGKLIYEYKIKLDKQLDCRVAYTLENDEILVFFISNIIIKREFVKLLEHVENVE